MPAQPKQLNKVGFSPREAAALQDIAGTDLKQLVAAGFTSTQANLLKTGPYDATTNAGGYDLRKLLVIGKFTRAQAKLILQA